HRPASGPPHQHRAPGTIGQRRQSDPEVVRVSAARRPCSAATARFFSERRARSDAPCPAAELCDCTRLICSQYTRSVNLLLAILLCLLADHACAAAPTLDHLFPIGWKQGSDATLTLGGKFDWP